MLGLFYPYGFLLQAIAILHFVRRRPETYWLFIILMGGALGALVYIAIEVVPDAGLLRGAFEVFPRRKRIKELEAAILDNPSVGNYEELGDLYLDEGKYAKARECYDKAITPRTMHADPFYRRGVAAIQMGDFSAAAGDLEHVTSTEPKYDSNRALGLLAHAYANTGQPADAETYFQRALEFSTLSETYVNYATFLAAQHRPAEARDWAERVLTNKAAMPRYLQRRERPWFRKAKALLKRLPKTG